MLAVGEQIPDMTLSDDQGNDVRLRDIPAPYILYFYPADDTPGCTKEACNFRDSYGALRGAGIDVYGVSPDSVESHVKFREKYDLPFRLLADTDHQLADAMGAWGERTGYGRTWIGILRSTFVVGPDGRVELVYPEVKPDEHASEILRDLHVS